MESLWVVAPPDENYLYIELLLVEYYRRNPGIGKSRHGNRQAEIREPEAPLAEKPNWWKSCKCSGHPIGGNLVKILQSKLCEQKPCSGKFCRSKPFCDSHVGGITSGGNLFVCHEGSPMLETLMVVAISVEIIQVKILLAESHAGGTP